MIILTRYNFLILLILLTNLFGVTLQSIYDTATPSNGFDKYLILEKDIIYTGEIGIYEGSVFIEGNGAIIDLNEGLGIWAYGEENSTVSLSVEYVTIINGGYNGLTFNGFAIGEITNCNFISNQFGIQIMDYTEVSIKNCNFISNSEYGFAVRGTTAIYSINYTNFWDNSIGNCGYNENC